MFNIADVIVIAIIGLAGFIGYKKGFIKTGFGFLSFFIALAITFMFYQPVMGIIKENTGFEKWLSEYLYNIDIASTSKDSESVSETTMESEEGKEYIHNLPTTIVNLLNLDEVKENAKNVIVQKIVDFAVKLLAIVIVYIVARIILAVVVIVLDLIAKLPVLKQFNEVLGLVIGILLGLVRIYVIFTIITLLSSLPMAMGITTVINQSLLASFLYNNNLLLKILF